MTFDERIAFLWNKALEDAIGAGHLRPFDHADGQVRPLIDRGPSARERREARIAQLLEG